MVLLKVRDSCSGTQHFSRKALISIGVGGKQLEWAGKSKYLGSLLNSAGNLDTELSRRQQQRVAAFLQLRYPLWRQKCIHTSTKMGVYVPCASVTSAAIYTAHTLGRSQPRSWSSWKYY